MIKSMTGYGRQKGENERREVQVEIKSVNHRYLDLNVKVPRIYSFLEEPIKTAVSAAVARGKVDIYLSIAAKEGGDVKVSPNLTLAGVYLRALWQVRDTYSLKDDISVMELSRMPDLLTVAREEPDAEEVKIRCWKFWGGLWKSTTPCGAPRASAFVRILPAGVRRSAKWWIRWNSVPRNRWRSTARRSPSG